MSAGHGKTQRAILKILADGTPKTAKTIADMVYSSPATKSQTDATRRSLSTLEAEGLVIKAAHTRPVTYRVSTAEHNDNQASPSVAANTSQNDASSLLRAIFSLSEQIDSAALQTAKQTLPSHAWDDLVYYSTNLTETLLKHPDIRNKLLERKNKRR